MTFSTTPITAAGSSAAYTQQYKKHFGDRPMAFALAEARPCSSLSSRSCGEPSAAPDAFATSSCATSSSSTVQEVDQAGVDTETHTALANLGWRIRARVNQGYSRTSTSADPFGGQSEGWASERTILNNVTNTRRSWSRTRTAPATMAASFDELRTGNIVHPPRDAVKRGRRTSDAQEEESAEQAGAMEHGAMGQQDVDMGAAAQRRIAGLPKLSFSSSVSSTTSHDSGFPASPTPLQTSRGFARSHSSSHSPFPTQTNCSADVEMDTDMPDAAAAAAGGKVRSVGDDGGYDFSAHFNRTDF